jgi:eukaryotic-like serine/threonine-protein kinase
VVGEVIAQRYELEELVGSGGMSSVFRARDRLLERNVALKILHAHYADDDDTIERFRREARAVAQLSHPNIVTVIDRGEEGGRQFIVFEYVDGLTLKEVVAERGPLPVRDAVELAIGVARGLAFAHAHGLVHRDVKPQNVLLNGDGKPKVTDFGIARSLDVQGVTQTGTVMGTSQYIAPEQASGQPVDALSDVYSLGAVLYELLTGDPPFDGENFVAVALKHVHEQPPSVLDRRPDVPPRLAAAVDRALAKRPADRFPTMDAFAAELEAVLAGLVRGDPDSAATMIVPGRVLRESRPARARRRRRNQWPLALAFVGAVLLAAAIAGILLTRHHDSNKSPSAGGGTGAAVALKGIAAYDPYGDGSEHQERVQYATDGNGSTYWETQHYLSFTKPGVGLVLDAGRTAKLSQLGVATATPGFQAQVKVSDSPNAGFQPDSAWQTIGSSSATIPLQGKSGRYYLLWLKLPFSGGVAYVNEVKAR